MPRHLVTLSPDRQFLIVAVSGTRTVEAARESVAEVIALREESGVATILFDTCSAVLEIEPAALMARALSCGRVLAPSRIAILADDDDSTYARVWRKGLNDTGHEALVFTRAGEAEAWLLTLQDAPTLFIS